MGKILETISGKKLELKESITAGERNEIRRVSADALRRENGEVSNQGTVQELLEKMLIEKVVISYDDSSENVYQRLLSVSPDEYDSVMNSVNEYAERFFTQVKPVNAGDVASPRTDI